MVRELYTHTRNYGCRLRRFTWNGVEMLTLENAKLKVAVALGKGADIVELVYKPMDVDCMWHSFNPLGGANHLATVADAGGNFMDAYSGGWQDLFPTYGAPARYCGGRVGIHGEACLYPWECRVLRDEVDCVEVLLTLRMQRSPFLLEKRLKLEGDAARLDMREVIVNESGVAQDFMWGQHPAFGAPFLDDSVRLRLGGSPDVVVPRDVIIHHTPFEREVSGKWPCLPGRDGRMIDLSRACAPEDRLYMEYCISNLDAGRYELVNENLGLGVRMSWDLDVCPYLWVWGLYRGIDVYPWYGRAYVMAVEPYSTYPADYEAAKGGGRLLKLEAGARMETALSCELFLDR